MGRCRAGPNRPPAHARTPSCCSKQTCGQCLCQARVGAAGPSVQETGPPSQTMLAVPLHASSSPPQDSAGTWVSVSWLEKALSKRKVLYLGGGVPGT